MSEVTQEVVPALTAEEWAEIGAVHTRSLCGRSPDNDRCNECSDIWPCEVTRLVATCETLRDELRSAEDREESLEERLEHTTGEARVRERQMLNSVEDARARASIAETHLWDERRQRERR